MQRLIEHIVLTGIIAAPPGAWELVEMAAEDFKPGSDTAGTLDFEAVSAEISQTLTRVSRVPAEDRGAHLYKSSAPRNVTDFPAI